MPEELGHQGGVKQASRAGWLPERFSQPAWGLGQASVVHWAEPRQSWIVAGALCLGLQTLLDRPGGGGGGRGCSQHRMTRRRGLHLTQRSGPSPRSP